MLRNAPMNYLISIAAAGLLWLLTGVVLGNYLADRVVLNLRTTEHFVTLHQVALGIAMLVGLGACLYWYFYGGKKSTASELPRAQRLWDLLLVGEVAIAALVVAVIGYLLSVEGLTLGQYLLIFLASLIQTALFFWISTLVLSPRTVSNVPRFRR